MSTFATESPAFILIQLTCTERGGNGYEKGLICQRQCWNYIRDLSYMRYKTRITFFTVFTTYSQLNSAQRCYETQDGSTSVLTCVLNAEGTGNSSDMWNTANGLNQQGYEGGPRGGLTSHHTEHGNYNNMTSHNHLVKTLMKTNPKGVKSADL